MNFTDYRDLNVWKESKELGVQIYLYTEEFPGHEKYGLTQQIRRAAVSILSNVAESCGREHVRDTLQFLYIARGSMYEVEAQMYLAYDLGYLSKEQISSMGLQTFKCKKILFGYISYHKGKIK